MRRIDLGQTIQIAANVGVILGILALIVELDQNSDAMEFQARTMLQSTRSVDMRSFAFNEGGIADLLEKARAGEELTDAETRRHRVFVANLFFNLEALYKEVVAGNLSEDDIPLIQWRGTYRDAFGMDGFFEATKETYDPAFAAFFQRNVVDVVNVR